MPKANIPMKYSAIGSFKFAQTMQKIANTPMASNKVACMIRGVWKEVKKAQKYITDTYEKTILEVYAERDEKGEIVRPPNDPQSFIPMKDKEEEFKKAQEDFGEKEFVFEYGPLTPAHLDGVKLSAEELDVLGDLFSEEAGPGLALVQN